MVTVDRGLPPAETAGPLLTRPWRPDGRGPEARPQGVPGKPERKERPGPDSAARPRAPSAVSSILGTRLDQGSGTSVSPRPPTQAALPLDSSTWSAGLAFSQRSWSPWTSARQSRRGGGVEGHGGAAGLKAPDSPCGDHRRGPRSGASGMGGGMFSAFGRQARGPPAASPHLRMWNRPQQQPWHNPQTSIRAAEAAADGAAPGAGGAPQRLDGPEQEHQGCTAAALVLRRLRPRPDPPPRQASPPGARAPDFPLPPCGRLCFQSYCFISYHLWCLLFFSYLS